MKNILSAAFVAAIALGATSASAVTLNIGDGQTGCESENNHIAHTESCDVGGNGDLGQSISSGDTVNFAGDGALQGWVRDRGGNSTRYADSAEVTLAESGFVTFSLGAGTQGFDGTLTFGDVVVDELMGQGGSTSVTFFVTAGTYDFVFDATDPQSGKRNSDTDYLMTVAAVPLPASALLILGGLGALGLTRRRKS